MREGALSPLSLSLSLSPPYPARPLLIPRLFWEQTRTCRLGSGSTGLWGPGADTWPPEPQSPQLLSGTMSTALPHGASVTKHTEELVGRSLTDTRAAPRTGVSPAVDRSEAPTRHPGDGPRAHGTHGHQIEGRADRQSAWSLGSPRGRAGSRPGRSPQHGGGSGCEGTRGICAHGPPCGVRARLPRSRGPGNPRGVTCRVGGSRVPPSWGPRSSWPPLPLGRGLLSLRRRGEPETRRDGTFSCGLRLPAEWA